MAVVSVDKKGFTLFELMLVIAVMAIIATLSRDFYTNFALDATIDNNAKTIMFDLRSARDKAMNGQNNSNWGLHFINSNSDYYQTFYSPTNYADAAKVIESSSYLHGSNKFSSPAEGSSTDIIFSKISGSASATDIIIISGSNARTISVNAQGLVN
jgi:prepilin-type N-terminal cleavage/methylation domain-containing protein